MEIEIDHKIKIYDIHKTVCGELIVSSYFEKLFVPPVP
jgi:hypothetical protein